MSFILSDIYDPLLIQLADRFHLPMPGGFLKRDVDQVLDRMHARLSYFNSRLKKSAADAGNLSHGSAAENFYLKLPA